MNNNVDIIKIKFHVTELDKYFCLLFKHFIPYIKKPNIECLHKKICTYINYCRYIIVVIL